MRSIFIILALFVFLSARADENLNSAIKNYQGQNFELALSELESQLQNSPQDSVLLYNLGLTLYRLGKPGAAIAKWRKALYIQPQFIASKNAIDYALGQMKEKPIAYQPSSTWGWIYVKTIDLLSLHFIFPLFLVVGILSTLKLSAFISAYKKAKMEDTIAPQVSIQTYSLLLLFILSGTLSYILWNNFSSPRATVTNPQQSSVRISPQEDSAEIFKIPEGTEVFLQESSDGWYKIEDPLGRAGWLKNTDAEITTDTI